MENIKEIQEGEEIFWKIFLKILFVHKTLCILSFLFLYDHINIFNRVRGLDWNFGKVARVPTILKRKAGTDGHERKWEKAEGAKEVEKAVEWQRETRERRTPATSAARFNYTLQTHDMSKSYTSYRLRHLLKVSSRAPRSRHRYSAVRPLLSGAPRKHIERKVRNIRTKSLRKE